MATRQELLTAAEQALASIGKTDAGEAESFVVMFEALASFLPEPIAPAPDEAEMFALLRVSGAEMVERVRAHHTASLDLAREILAVDPDAVASK